MKSLLDELPSELDVRLELDANRLTLVLTSEALLASGLHPGERLSVDLHPLSLRLETLPRLTLPLDPFALAQVDLEGRLSLPIEPPFLTSDRVVLQIRHRGLYPELYLVADS